MPDYQTYYASIERPFFAPPEWVFGVAWGIIYPLIAAAFVYVLYLTVTRRVPPRIVLIFALNIVANVLFTPLQLGYPDTPFATIDILIILGTLGYLMRELWWYSKIATVLLIPYLLWGAFATVLQVTIYGMNFL